MPTKIGRVKFKDIRQGRTFWRINWHIAVTVNGFKFQFDKPFRVFVDSTPYMAVYASYHRRKSMVFDLHCDHDLPCLSERTQMQLIDYNVKDDKVMPHDVCEGLAMFVNYRAVMRFIKAFKHTPITDRLEQEALDLDAFTDEMRTHYGT